MGLFGNMGSTKASNSTTNADSSTNIANLSSQNGSVASIARGATAAYDGGIIATGKGRVTINQNLSDKIAHDSIQGISDLAHSSINAAAAQSQTLSDLANANQQGILAAVTGHAVTSDSARFIMPLALGAGLLILIVFMARK